MGKWEEAGIPLTVTFELTSPGNRWREMVRKFRFHERYGVEEYDVVDPDEHQFEAWHRAGKRLRPVKVNGELVNPRLGVRFEWRSGADVLRDPDGQPFLTFRELGAARRKAEERVAALAAKLMSLGIDPDAVSP